MLQLGGARVSIIGFDRRPSFPKSFDFISLGLTYDAALFRRTISVMISLFKIWRISSCQTGFDVIIARNLEMLPLAHVILRRSRHKKARLIFECLDLHRVLLKNCLIGFVLRRIEKLMLLQASTIILSSAAFYENYFSKVQKFRGNVLLVENKKLSPARINFEKKSSERKACIIGYFGMLRCQKTVDILRRIAHRSGSGCEILIAGIPSPAVFPNFTDEVIGLKNVRYVGSYDPESIGTLYGQVDFAWCIDFYEEGFNSALLLPNRLYESLSYGVIPLAMEGTETANWLKKRNVGKVFEHVEEIEVFFLNLNLDTMLSLKEAIALLPQSSYLCSVSDCADFVRELYPPK